MLFPLLTPARGLSRRLDLHRHLDHARRQEPSIRERPTGDGLGLDRPSCRANRPSRHPTDCQSRRMPALQEEAHRRQPGLSALRPAVRKPRGRIIWIATVVLTAAALFDWTRPPRQQISVTLYERIVIGGYRVLLKPLSNRFVRCRFQPTCSLYSQKAMRAHGFPKGLWLTTARLFRCMPWVPADTYDPVPP